MEAMFTPYSPFQQQLCTSPPSRNRHRRLYCRHHGCVGLTSAMRFHTVQRITTALSRFHPHTIQFSPTNTSYLDLSFELSSYSTMDDSDTKKEIKPSDGSSVAKDTKETQKSSEIPPPPEKPLPADCCGSGCVRCVWDVYFDELAEYNKLYKRE